MPLRILLLDGMSALAVAREVRPAAPFIFVSGTMGEETAIDALQHGATDYVLKQRLSRLGPALRRALLEMEERRQREQAEKGRREAEHRFRALFEQSPDGIVILEPETARILEGQRAPLQLRHLLKEMAQIIKATFPKYITLRILCPNVYRLSSPLAIH